MGNSWLVGLVACAQADGAAKPPPGAEPPGGVLLSRGSYGTRTPLRWLRQPFQTCTRHTENPSAALPNSTVISTADFCGRACSVGFSPTSTEPTMLRTRRRAVWRHRHARASGPIILRWGPTPAIFILGLPGAPGATSAGVFSCREHVAWSSRANSVALEKPYEYSAT